MNSNICSIRRELLPEGAVAETFVSVKTILDEVCTRWADIIGCWISNGKVSFNFFFRDDRGVNVGRVRSDVERKRSYLSSVLSYLEFKGHCN